MRVGLDELRRTCPSFVAVTDLVDRAIALSLLTDMPLTLPPILLSGPPGVGKTHYSKALAAVLGVPVHAWSCATNSDAMQLITGHPTSWPVSYTHLDVYKRQLQGRPDLPWWSRGAGAGGRHHAEPRECELVGGRRSLDRPGNLPGRHRGRGRVIACLLYTSRCV